MTETFRSDQQAGAPTEHVAHDLPATLRVDTAIDRLAAAESTWRESSEAALDPFGLLTTHDGGTIVEVRRDGVAMQVQFGRPMRRGESPTDMPYQLVTDPMCAQLLSRLDTPIVYRRPDAERSIDPSPLHTAFDRTEIGRSTLVAHMVAGAEYATALTGLATTAEAVAAEASEPLERPQIAERLRHVGRVIDSTSDRLTIAHPAAMPEIGPYRDAIARAEVNAWDRESAPEANSDLALSLAAAAKLLR